MPSLGGNETSLGFRGWHRLSLGVEGLYLVVPFLMFSGFVLAITGSWDKPDVSGRVGYGFTLAALGIGMFWSHFGLKGTESSSNFSIFRMPITLTPITGSAITRPMISAVA
jgi:hypothetical protein